MRASVLESLEHDSWPYLLVLNPVESDILGRIELTKQSLYETQSNAKFSIISNIWYNINVCVRVYRCSEARLHPRSGWRCSEHSTACLWHIPYWGGARGATQWTGEGQQSLTCWSMLLSIICVFLHFGWSTGSRRCDWLMIAVSGCNIPSFQGHTDGLQDAVSLSYWPSCK